MTKLPLILASALTLGTSICGVASAQVTAPQGAAIPAPTKPLDYNPNNPLHVNKEFLDKAGMTQEVLDKYHQAAMAGKNQGSVPLTAADRPAATYANGSGLLDSLKRKDPNKECLAKQSESSTVLVIGGKFIDGKRLQPHQRFDNILKVNFKSKVNLGIESNESMTSQEVAEKLPSYLAKHKPTMVIIDTAISDMEKGFTREQSAANLSKILSYMSKFKVETVLIEGPASLRLDSNTKADPMYQQIATRWDARVKEGIYRGLSLSSQPLVDENTPGIDRQFILAQYIADSIKQCSE